MSVQTTKRNKIEVHCLTVGPFQENTFVVVHDNRKISIIDPGVSNAHEEKILMDLISSISLPIEQILNTHCHIDHIMGVAFLQKKFQLLPMN